MWFYGLKDKQVLLHLGSFSSNELSEFGGWYLSKNYK